MPSETGKQTKQDILYIQTQDTDLRSQILGMNLVINGDYLDLPSDPEEWPYSSVLEAINDGWRIVVFPDLALLMQDGLPKGLGCEFILEKLG